MSLTCMGAAGTVTGSRHLIEADGKRILLDCGMFQGRRDIRTRNWEPFPVAPYSIDKVVLSHAHMDHSGYVPRLIRDGYAGEILCSPPTVDLCGILLPDSGYLQERDAEYANRKKFSRHEPALPLYTEDEAEASMERFREVEFGIETDIGHGAQLKLRRAGHILGAATVELKWHGRTIAFSGDLGRYDDPVLFDPDPIGQADYLLLETTYGDRLHGQGDPGELLADIVERTTARGGTVVIPSFAVGRAQLLTYYLWKMKKAGRLQSVPVYLDSPMAINASAILRRHFGDHRISPGDADEIGDMVNYVRETEDSKTLTIDKMPKVIISASGMATGGRILHHLKAYAPDPRNTIVISGFQAPGTPGAMLVAGADTLRIHGRNVPIQAEVEEISMLSAHADTDELMRWLGGFKRPPRQTFLVHGEPDSSQAMRERIERELGWSCAIPGHLDRFEL
ncbi:MBL fold metallo-hydrolase RNA specificity domain-containing protein [Maricaulis salignorans]|nr:MBL fold metallo-hydrolase [Maricaulis salignorans]